jgi:hypothetical protein
MDENLRREIERYVEEHISSFHVGRVNKIEKLILADLLKSKNPYLFRAKGLNTAPSYVKALLDAKLSSSEESIFGTFLEHLALFISGQTRGGRGSSASGLDIELLHQDTHYLIAVKSGVSWGNSSQWKTLRQEFSDALKRQKQRGGPVKLQPMLGICYGSVKRSETGLYIKLVGQDFWELISGDPELYKTIIEPIGHKAHEENARFELGRKAVEERLTGEFAANFCHADDTINWGKIVELVSKNKQLLVRAHRKKSRSRKRQVSKPPAG